MSEQITQDTVKPLAILCFDIETSGSNIINNAILSIGYCLGDQNGNILKKDRFSFEMDSEHCFEERCYKDFWSKNMDILKTLQDEAKPIKEQLLNFITLVDKFDDEYDLRIISDFKDFDLAFVNYYLVKYLNRRPLNYKFGSTEYRCTYDTDSYSRGAMKMNYQDPWTSDKTIMEQLNFTTGCNPTHLPDDDAEYIYKFHINLINKIN